MPYYNGEKWACSSCMKGHRSSKCMHTDRILYKVRKPGRPLNNCPHTLPEKIKPGTFVNTSPASMGNGVKGPCGCKGGQVEVAIPKVKHCSCTKADDSSDPSAQTVMNPGSAPGVKSGRVTKKQNRRKKSIVPDGVLEAAKENAGMNGTPKTPSREAPPNMDQSLTMPTGFPTETHRQDPHVNSTFRQVSGIAAGFPPQQTNDMLSRWQQPHHLMDGSISTPVSINMPNNVPLQSQPPTPGPQTPGPDQFSMASQPGTPFFMGGPPLNPPGFFGFPKTDSSQMMGPDSSSTPVVMASFNPTSIAASHANAIMHDKIMVPLTHHEYLWIQHARASGVDFSKLPKFIAGRESPVHGATNGAQFTLPQPSPMGFSATTTGTPPTPAVSSFPEPPPMPNGGGGGCCKPKSAPSPAEAISAGSSSPRCKCGDACRCVPCADHPFNPAMLETIKGDMLFLQDPASRGTKKSPPASNSGNNATQNIDHKDSPTSYEPDNYNDGNSPANSASASVMADFNFVFQNYNYEGGCSEGQGGCMCGEGCTCVGCLTHGGHDGVSLEMLGGAANAGVPQVNGSDGKQPQQQQQQQQIHASGPGHAP